MPDYYFKPTKPKEVTDGLKARSKRGSFAKNWWAQRWIAALERLVDSGRLSRGRSYARKGQVISIDETKTGIEARVQGSRKTPYKVKIQVSRLNDTEWEQVFDYLAEQAIFTAQLLAGDMPQDIEQAFDSVNISLFPSRGYDLETSCSCPDYANPCKHVAATHYILGERFDEDPFLIFRLRGKTQDQVLEALRHRRSNDVEPEEESQESETISPLEEQIEAFWEFSAPLIDFSISIQTPSIEMPILKRLGEASFVPSPGIESLMRNSYLHISKKAVETAYKEAEN